MIDSMLICFTPACAVNESGISFAKDLGYSTSSGIPRFLAK